MFQTQHGGNGLDFVNAKRTYQKLYSKHIFNPKFIEQA